MIKKICLSILVSTSLFSNDLNSFFKEQNININCENNICIGNNVSQQDINIKYVKFNKDNIDFEKFDLNCKENIECKNVENKETFNSILFKSLVHNLSLNDYISKDISIKNVSSNTNLPILKIFDDFKNLNFNSLINNDLNIKINGFQTTKNEFSFYADYVKSYLKELKTIPKDQWDDEIAEDVEYNLNLLKVLNKFSFNSEKDSSDYYLTLTNKKLKGNYEYELNFIGKSNLKYYSFKLDFTLENTTNLEKNLDKITNKELAMTLILPNINIKNLSLHINTKQLNDLHNKFMNEDQKYKEAYEIVQKHFHKESIVDDQYKNDKEFVAYNNFIKNLIDFKYNNHYASAKNQDKLLLTKLLLDKSNEDFDLDKLFDSLDWTFSNNE